MLGAIEEKFYQRDYRMNDEGKLDFVFGINIFFSLDALLHLKPLAFVRSMMNCHYGGRMQRIFLERDKFFKLHLENYLWNFSNLFIMHQ